MVVSQNYGYHFGGSFNKDYSILGSILGSPYLGKLPYTYTYISGDIRKYVETHSSMHSDVSVHECIRIAEYR